MPLYHQNAYTFIPESMDFFMWEKGHFSWDNLDFLFLFKIYLFSLQANYFTILYWFCHALTWISHGCTCVPHPETRSHIPPHPIPLSHPSTPALSTLSHASNLDWRSVSHMIIYICFNAILSNHPILSFSHRVQKTVLYICVSFAV